VLKRCKAVERNGVVQDRPAWYTRQQLRVA
jgi:hypothetical protein